MTTPHVIAVVTALIASVVDVRTRRIPNELTFGSAALALMYHSFVNRGDGFILSTEGWAVGAVFFIVPFALGGLGGGDVKLLAAIGAWIGPWDMLWVALYTGVAGGVSALVVAACCGYLRQALSNVRLLLTHWHAFGLRPLYEITLEGSRGPRLAYGVPICIGLLARLWLR